MLYLTFILCFVCSILITPVVKKLAFTVGATDQPNHRKVHHQIMPRLGGLAIYISFLLGILILRPDSPYHAAIVAGGAIILITGVLDDIYDLSAKVKFILQIAAALIVVLWGGVDVDFINLPFNGRIDFGILTIPITVIWIVGITNAINLIDGLDGLAAGVSSIGLLTITAMAVVMGNVYVMTMGVILIASTLGFLKYNFHPAKIFMGDSGALFLGYMISVLSLLGFKNIAVISFVVPIIILGVPISDTFFAIIRRLYNKNPLSAPDKSHLHHCILKLGYTHRETVLLIYAMSAMFGLAAFIFTMTTVWGSIIFVIILLVAIEIFVENIGLINKNYKPLLRIMGMLKNR
ncbi:glycosyltransferase family 4 protein [Neobacillus mesonae]|uniref:glycosyltransferase family 4 protein n=1 Tax=Neobacillus mesonae TaxID=1193713 RepID=UPI00203BAC92|nr:MraY family glycosyltransferase [Neobacillus mesonae]MCM3567395.1 undecaprenyl/decaprenyl-phosphate alpha-N-acetylglucosaminyl 1-phosphate transferase [Neobacillus mesonae]